MPPVPSATAPWIIVSPGPVTERLKLAADTGPLSVSDPASDLIRVAAVSVTAPPKLLEPLRFRRAPSAEAPEPEPSPARLNDSAPMEMLLLSSRAALLATVVPPAVLPSAVLELTTSVPALMVVTPVYELSPLRVSVPAAILVTAPDPEMFPPKVRAFDRLKIRVPLSTTSPVMLPVVEPPPIWRVEPVLIVVPPV